MIQSNQKISVIVPIFNVEKYLKQCLDSIIFQTYTNLEIILVDDFSTDNSKNILYEYKNKDARVIVIEHDKNLGLFATRVTGLKKASGDYIVFVDSDDFISLDLMRRLVNSQLKYNTDIVIAQHALFIDELQQFKFEPINQVEFDYLEGTKLKDIFFNNLGLRYSWQIVWCKLYKSSLLLEELNLLVSYVDNKINLFEDVIFNSIIFNKINNMSSLDFVGYFYRKHNQSITSKTIRDKKYFSLLSHILKSSIESKYHACIDQLIIRDNDGGRFILQYDFNNNYDKLINKVIDAKYPLICFDLFDTLIQRPLYSPEDLFEILSIKYIELTNDPIPNFAEIRLKSEYDARRISKNHEITLDEIYFNIHKNFGIGIDVLNEIKTYEISVELDLCVPRKSMFEIYQLALHLKKKIFILSDMYLPINVITNILNKNGYYDYDEILLSSEIMHTKSSGNKFAYLLKNFSYKSNEILHIGDNQHSDYMMPKSYGIEAFLYPKAIDVFLGNINSNCSSYKHITVLTEQIKSHFGIRCMLATVAIKFYDNPFTTVAHDSFIGRNPYWLGYYQLGIFILNFVHWLYDKSKDYKQIAFLARDGYLIKKVFDVFNQNIYQSSTIQSNYLEVSRHVLYCSTVIDNYSFMKLISKIYLCIDINKLLPVSIKLKNKNFEKISNLIREINTIQNVTNLYNENKQLNTKIKQYLEQNILTNACFVDIGYGRRSHLILFKYCNAFKKGFFIQQNAEYENLYNNFFNIESFFETSNIKYYNTNAVIMEYILSDYIKGTVKDYVSENGVIKPIYAQNEYDNKVLLEVKLIHQGAIDFANTFTKLFKNYWQSINFNYSSAKYILENTLIKMNDIDFRYFKDAFLDDTMNNAQYKLSNLNDQKEYISTNDISTNALLKILYIRYKNLPFKILIKKIIIKLFQLVNKKLKKFIR